MKNLGAIIDAVKEGKRPEYDELRFSLLAMESLLTFSDRSLMQLAQAEKERREPKLVWSAVFQYEEQFNRLKRALATDPKAYVGWSNDPDNPDYRHRRATALAIAEWQLRKQ